MSGFSLRGLPIPAVLLLAYAGWIALGTLALLLPWATPSGIGVLDAVFTATSAVTVTGLVVRDTGSEFTLFGQGVIMVLIQLGGLGLITFATFVLSALGRSLDITKRRFLAEELDLGTFDDLVPFVRRILLIFLVGEALGLALLATQFVPELGWGQGLWDAAFHSVSAFNNAGFSTFSSSLVEWNTNPVVMVTISLQFILSGLGFIVLSEAFRVRRWSRLSLHSQMMLLGTPALVVVGALGFAVLEWTNPATLGALEAWQRPLAAFFEGVTPRTAGFNATDTGAHRDATALLTMGLMFIGGGATSTAGGIKVTTAFVLLLASVAFFHRSGIIRFQRHEVGSDQGLKVMALIFVSLAVIFLALFAIVATHDFDFLDATFEVVSAFGTVGLSRGVTGELNAVGQVAIIIVMFLGRVGPLTLGFMLATKTPPRVRYPEGVVHLG